MNLTITDKTNEPISGKSLGQHLKEGLVGFEQTTNHAGNLITAAEQAGVEIEIVSAADGTGGHASGQKVSLPANVIYKNETPAQGLKADGIKELVESCLFEIKNALNSQRYGNLKTQIENGTITLKAYGTGYSDIETESCWVVNQILSEAKQHNYIPSANWGAKLLTKYQGASSLNAAKGITSTSPHKPGADNYFALNTPEVYAFEYVLNLGNQQKILRKLISKAVPQIRYAPMGQPPQTYTNNNVFDRIRNSDFYGTTHANITSGVGDWCVTFYHFFIDVLDYLTGLGFGQKGTWMVTWTGGSSQGWQFSNAMKQYARKQAADSALNFIKSRIPYWGG